MKNRDSDWEKLSREAAGKNGVLNQPGLSVGIVSFRTMGRAASPDARKKEDDQQKVMGFSATDVSVSSYLLVRTLSFPLSLPFYSAL